RVKTSGRDDVDIKLFPSLATSEEIIINPFLLYLRQDNGNWLKTAVAFSEYPARVFPDMAFKYVPPCPKHPFFPHPNINIDDGFLNIRPSVLFQPSIDVDKSIRLIQELLAYPWHYDGACSPFTQATRNVQEFVVLSTYADTSRNTSARIEQEFTLV